MAENKSSLREIIARSWKDEEYKKKLISDPKATLAAAGINVGNMNVKVHVDTPDTLNLVIPQNPAQSPLSEEALDAVSGGTHDTVLPSTCPENC